MEKYYYYDIEMEKLFSEAELKAEYEAYGKDTCYSYEEWRYNCMTAQNGELDIYPVKVFADEVAMSEYVTQLEYWAEECWVWLYPNSETRMLIDNKAECVYVVA